MHGDKINLIAPARIRYHASLQQHTTRAQLSYTRLSSLLYLIRGSSYDFSQSKTSNHMNCDRFAACAVRISCVCSSLHMGCFSGKVMTAGWVFEPVL